MLRVNWQWIKANGNEDPFAFVFSSLQRDLILSIIDRLEWRATYDTNGYDYSDYDELSDIVQEAKSELLKGWNVNEITEAINNLSAIVAGIQQTVQVNMDCPDITLNTCTSSNSLGVPTEPEEGQPVYDEEPSDETQEPDTETYKEYKCKLAHKLMDNRRAMIADFFAIVQGQSPYGDLYTLVSQDDLGHPVYVVLMKFMSFIASNVYGDLIDDALAIFDSVRDSIICAIYTAATPKGAKMAVESVIQGAEGAFVPKYLVEMFLADTVNFDGIWIEGEYDVTGYESVACDCSFSPVFEWTHNAVSDFCQVSEPILTPYTNGLEYWAEVSKGGTYGSYSLALTARDDGQPLADFSNRVVTFENLVQNQNAGMSVFIEHDAGTSSAVVFPGATAAVDLAGKTVTEVRFQFNIGIYNQPCPMICSGTLAWS